MPLLFLALEAEAPLASVAVCAPCRSLLHISHHSLRSQVYQLLAWAPGYAFGEPTQSSMKSCMQACFPNSSKTWNLLLLSDFIWSTFAVKTWWHCYPRSSLIVKPCCTGGAHCYPRSLSCWQWTAQEDPALARQFCGYFATCMSLGWSVTLKLISLVGMYPNEASFYLGAL